MAFGAIAGAAIGGILANRGQKKANQSNRAEAGLNRDWQERQSSTAHQRQVADMRAAGLNPILSATGGAGASTGAGAQATVENENKQAAEFAKETPLIRSTIKQIDADIKLKKQLGEQAVNTASSNYSSQRKPSFGWQSRPRSKSHKLGESS